MDRVAVEDFSNLEVIGIACVFKVYPMTTFKQLLHQACVFWQRQNTQDKFYLTDEYYNSIQSFSGTVQQYFNLIYR